MNDGDEMKRVGRRWPLLMSVLLAAAILFTVSGPARAAECLVGEVRWFASIFAPRNWALAHGQLLQIDRNPALFTLLGTIYGGDGRETFGLPDLRGRHVIGTSDKTGVLELQVGTRHSYNVPAVKPDDEQVGVSPYLALNPIICVQGVYPTRQ